MYLSKASSAQGASGGFDSVVHKTTHEHNASVNFGKMPRTASPFSMLTCCSLVIASQSTGRFNIKNAHESMGASGQLSISAIH